MFFINFRILTRDPKVPNAKNSGKGPISGLGF